MIKIDNVIVERYSDTLVKTKVFDKPPPEKIPNAGGGKRGESENPERTIVDSLRRTKSKIFDLVLSNKWEYWATQTFSTKYVDRYNLDDIIVKFNQRLNNVRKRKYDFKYLLIPELHKDGAIHLHGFFKGIPSDRIKYSGYDYFNREKNFSRKIYNWLDTIDYGLNDFVQLDTSDKLGYLKMAKYCIKYVTKELIENRFNRKRYWSSKGLKTSVKYKFKLNRFDETFKNKLLNPQMKLSQSSYFVKNDKGLIFNRITETFSLIIPSQNVDKDDNLFDMVKNV